MSSDTNRDRALGADRGLYALELRKQGLTYQAIGVALGVHSVAAFNLVKRRLAKIQQKTTELAESVRSLELERLDKMLERLDQKIEKGDVMAISVALKIQERRSKYLGLDAPEKSVVLITNRPDELANAIMDDIEDVVPSVYKGESVN